jgi:predicted transcriptional regulator
MSTFTIRLSNAKHERLKAFARARSVSVNTLVEELATVALAQADTENRYLLRKALGKPAVGLQLLDTLDRKVQQRRRPFASVRRRYLSCSIDTSRHQAE